MIAKRSGMTRAWLMTTLLLTACGGGGSSSPSNGTPAAGTTYTLSGQAQKGPFAIGSSIGVNEIDSSMNPTGKVYNVQTTDNLGDFVVSSQIGTPLVEIVGNGYYMDELTGQLASSQITLRAVVDLSVNATPTVNVLTTLQEQRLKTLITQGGTYAAANVQSQTEVLAAFGIDTSKVNSLSNLYSMQINGSTDADAVLLATSVILSKMAANAAVANGTSQPTELSNYINTVAQEISNTGTITDSTFIPARNLAETQINQAAVRANLETYYASRGVTMVAPKFEEWIDQSNSGILPQRLVPTTGLSFTDTSGVDPKQSITSNTITLSGLGAGIVVPVTTDANTTLNKNGTAVTGTTTTAIDGDTIALRATSLGYGLTNTSTITIGSSSATWRVTSKPLGGTLMMLTGTGLVLQNNSGDNITIPAGTTTFNFTAPVANGAGYNVTVLAQPTTPAQICTVANGTGTVGAALSNVIVSCAGPVSGLAYTDVTGVDPNQAITSNAITVSGLGTGIVATVATGTNTTLIKNGTAVTGTTTTAIDGDTIAMRVTSLGYGLTNTSTITIASSSAVWRVVTKPLGGTISGLTGTGLVLQNNGGDNITIPAGSTSFSFPASVENGASYSVSVLTQPTSLLQICTASNSTGTVGAALSNISVVCTTQVGIVYVPYGNHAVSYAISTYAIDPTTGALTNIGTFAAGYAPSSVTVDPTGKFAYITNSLSNDISAYSINATTGALIQVNCTGGITFCNGNNFLAGTYPNCVTVDPTGKFAYVANVNSNDIAAYSINTTTGALNSIGTIAAGTAPFSVTVDPTGKFVYVANGSSNDISAYNINTTTGALTNIGTFAAGTTPYSITVDPTGKFAYVANTNNSNNISAYSINATTGALTNIGTFAAGTTPSSVTVDPTGKFAYVTNALSNDICAYSINATTGALTSIGTFATGTNPRSVTVDPTGKFAYVANMGSFDISAYSINATTGALTSIGTFATGSDPMSIAIKSLP